jgi:hypothetical protein
VGSATVTGLRELQAAIQKLPDAVTAALKAEARASAGRIAAHAASLLRAQTHRTGRTAAAIRVLEEGADKQFVVNSPGTADKPANLPIWLEYGTRFMTAKPHMRPAADAESATYKQHMAAAAERAAQKVLG